MKILYVTTISNTVNAFLIPHIKMLINCGHQVDLAFNVVQEIDSELVELGCKIYNLDFQRSPMNVKNFSAYKNLKYLIRNQKYDIVHTHTPVASACVRLAKRKMKNIRVFYTAHGFHFFKGAPIKNWLLYYPLECYLAKYTDVLITINKEDYERAKKSLKAKRIEFVPGVGLDTKKLKELIVNTSAKRNELKLPKDAYVITSVGELNQNKNHETVIKALAMLNNPNIYYLICGKGPLENDLRGLVKRLDLEKQVKLLGFRKDVSEIYNISDVYVFPSYREGLSVALMEAMACRLPIICSDIRGNRDLVDNDKGGYLVNPNDISGFAKLIGILQKCPKKSETMANYNIKKINTFSLNHVIKRMNEIYTKS